MNISIDCLKKIGKTNLLLNVDMQGIKQLDWAESNSGAIENLIQKNGAILIRGLEFLNSKQFGKLLSILFGSNLMQYTYRSTPRTELRGNVYTATEYHANQVIPQHNENSYSNKWVMRIGFLCMVPPENGGETPICDCRLVYNMIPKDIREKFEKKKIKYVRNYSEIDLPWSEVFQTNDKAEVERYCKENNIYCEWRGKNELRTYQINQATAVHPVTNDKVWFNQAHLFHTTSLDKEIQENMLSLLGEENLPRNTYYGDGTPIEKEALNIIRNIYEQVKIKFEWKKNDLLLLDNMLYAHGREPFIGRRQVLVGMAKPYCVL